MANSKLKKALIVIDVQNCFINKQTSFLPKKIASYIKRNKFDYLLFTKFINKNNSNFFTILNWRKCTSSPETDIHNELNKFITKDNLFKKNTYSIFKAKGFSNFLKKNKITTLYLCGIDTNACVLASAFEGFDLNYKVKIIESLCFSHSGKNFHNSAIKIIKKCIEQ